VQQAILPFEPPPFSGPIGAADDGDEYEHKEKTPN